MWDVGGPHPVKLKALIEQRLTSPEQEGILPADHLWTQTQLFSRSPACWPTLHILDFHMSPIS